MDISIRLVDGESLVFSVKTNTCTIGRSPSCEVVLAKEGISRKHCLLEVIQGDIFITDLASTNGVLIDGKKIPPSTRMLLPPFLPISFGSVETMHVELEMQPSAILRHETTRFNKISTNLPTRTKKLNVPEKGAIKLSAIKTPVNYKGMAINVFAFLIIALGCYWYFTRPDVVQDESSKSLIKETKTKKDDYF